MVGPGCGAIGGVAKERRGLLENERRGMRNRSEAKVADHRHNDDHARQHDSSQSVPTARRSGLNGMKFRWGRERYGQSGRVSPRDRSSAERATTGSRRKRASTPRAETQNRVVLDGCHGLPRTQEIPPVSEVVCRPSSRRSRGGSWLLGDVGVKVGVIPWSGCRAFSQERLNHPTMLRGPFR